MQIIVKNNIVVATHPDHVMVPEGSYPGAVEIHVPGPEGGFSPGDPFKIEERPTKEREGDTRAKRDQLLAASDWTQLNDAPLTTAQVNAWKIYRQDLRDLNMKAPDWPTPPELDSRRA